MTCIPYLGTFFFSRYPSVALARNARGEETMVGSYAKLAAPKEKLFIWPPFFQYNKRLLRQKTGGACLCMPQDGH